MPVAGRRCCIRRWRPCFCAPGSRGCAWRPWWLSHRHCIALFRQATGLAPNAWLRLQRFSHALELACDRSLGWAEIAAASGFADQAHLANTFRSVAGVAPSAWRRMADPAAPRHVPR
ncbi:helix-turn-helix domain-containing protein [Xanthomonas sacchari]|uniref:helix-turn-helix domain-containing protein n=1 Tax=Xanthomonas sacchari TaxID=56458 RepID=UPI0020C54285|nr:helix-turn-helix domain-containing protein [Xanthomonas sacchari]